MTAVYESIRRLTHSVLFGLVLIALTIIGGALLLLDQTNDADDRATVAEARLAGQQDQVLDFAAKLYAACDAGVIEGAVCEAASEVVEAAPVPPVVEDLTEQLTAAVTEALRECVESGLCVGPQGSPGPPGTPGPTGSPGPPGATPTEADLTAAVVAACGTVVDCTVSPDEIAAAVSLYCAGPSEPCGKKWTEEEIYRIANRAVVDYLTGRPIWCPAENEVPNDQPFGPCYVSAG